MAFEDLTSRSLHAGAAQPALLATFAIRLRFRRNSDVVESFAVDAASLERPVRVQMQDNAIVLGPDSVCHRGDSPSADEMLALLTRSGRIATAGSKRAERDSAQVALVMDGSGRLTGLAFFDGQLPLAGILNGSVNTITPIAES
jgi:hypothetical protein